jgi:hypothetical protein
LSETDSCVREINEALFELKSDLFSRFAAFVLAHANVLNAYSFSERNAQGFELSSLLQLENIKSGDKKTTLLNFIIDEIDQVDPDVLLFDEEARSACSIGCSLR